MAIARKPSGKQRDIGATSDEKAAEAFIAKAGKAPQAEQSQRSAKTPVLLRFDDPLLERIDAAARRRSVKRTPWIMYVITKALEEEEL